MPPGTAKPLGHRRQSVRIWESREQFFTELGLFFLGAAGTYSVNVIGMLPGNEILLLAVLPVALLIHSRRAFRASTFGFTYWYSVGSSAQSSAIYIWEVRLQTASKAPPE